MKDFIPPRNAERAVARPPKRAAGSTRGRASEKWVRKSQTRTWNAVYREDIDRAKPERRRLTMVTAEVIIKVSNDLGNGDGIDRFQPAYEFEVKNALQEAVEEITGEWLPVDTDLVDYGKTELFIFDPDDDWTAEQHAKIQEAFDRITASIDISDKRFDWPDNLPHWSVWARFLR